MLMAFVLSMTVKFFLIVQDPFLALHCLLHAHKSWNNNKTTCNDLSVAYKSYGENMSTKSWFEVIQYVVCKKMVMNSDTSRIAVAKSVMYTKVVHACLRTLQEDLSKVDLEAQFYAIINDGAQTGTTPRIDEKILARYYLGYLLQQLYCERSYAYEERTKYKIDVNVLTENQYKDLLGRIEEVSDIKETIKRYCVKRSVSIKKVVEVVEKLDEECAINGFNMNILCYVLLTQFDDADTIVLLAERSPEVAWLFFACISRPITVSTITALNHIFSHYLLKPNDVLLRYLICNNAPFETTGILLNSLPKEPREHFRVNLIKHHTTELEGLISVVSRAYSLCAERNTKLAGRAQGNKIVNLENILNLLNSSYKSTILASAIYYRLTTLKISLVSKGARKLLFKVNAHRVKSYNESFDSVLAHFTTSEEVNKYFKDIICTERRIKGSIMKMVRLCWLLRIMAKIAKYKENERKQWKLLIYALKLKAFKGMVVEIPEVTRIETVPYGNIGRLVRNIKLYCEDLRLFGPLKKNDEKLYDRLEREVREWNERKGNSKLEMWAQQLKGVSKHYLFLCLDDEFCTYLSQFGDFLISGINEQQILPKSYALLKTVKKKYGKAQEYLAVNLQTLLNTLKDFPYDQSQSSQPFCIKACPLAEFEPETTSLTADFKATLNNDSVSEITMEKTDMSGASTPVLANTARIYREFNKETAKFVKALMRVYGSVLLRAKLQNFLHFKMAIYAPKYAAKYRRRVAKSLKRKFNRSLLINPFEHQDSPYFTALQQQHNSPFKKPGFVPVKRVHPLERIFCWQTKIVNSMKRGRNSGLDASFKVLGV